MKSAFSNEMAASRHPSVFGLCHYLADEKVTTGEQRAQLRQALNDFLNNDIPLTKFYNYVGQIIGSQQLYDIMSQLRDGLDSADPVEPPRKVCKKDEQQVAVDSSRVHYSCLAMTDHIRRVPVWMESCTPSPGVFWGLAGSCTSPFMALGHALDNACQPWVSASRVDIDLAIDPEGRVEISIQDNGTGLSFKEFHSCLKQIAGFKPTDVKTKPWRYGLGFKIAFARLGLGSLLITQTEQMIGMGMCSLPLMGHVHSNQLIAPAVVWQLPDRVLMTNGFPAVNHRQTQKLIMQYSSYRSPAALAAQIQALRSESGTRVILYDLRDDFPGLAVDENTGRIHHEAFTHGKTAVKASDLKWDLWTEESCGRKVMVADASRGFLPETFPFWTKPEDGLDGCLATFLFWARLHKKCVLSLAGVALSVPEEEGSDDSGFAGGLYRVLKKTLHNSVEVANIFQGGDLNLQCVGLIGFLNPGRAAAALELPSDVEDNGLLESGVLLYHQDRLISRLEVPLHGDPVRIRQLGDLGVYDLPPVTCVLNVPDWLLPNMAKNGFVHEGGHHWREVKQRIDCVLREFVAHAKAGSFQGWQYCLKTQLEQ